MNDQLLPCPFCGERAVMAVYLPENIESGEGHCWNDDCIGWQVTATVAEWNTRAQPTSEPKPVENAGWSNTKPCQAGAYWIRGNGLEQDALVQVIEDAEDGLRCNLHMRNSESDFGWGYALADLSDEFEWQGPLFAHPAPAVAVLPDPESSDVCPYWTDGPQRHAWIQGFKTAAGMINK